MHRRKKPHIIAITEAKPKNYSGELLASEFELDGYNVFYDGGKDDSSRGILVYASAEISAAYMEESISFKEYLLIKRFVAPPVAKRMIGNYLL